MKLYIDESGNTGETLCVNSRFNFEEQPYYVLAGISLNDSQRENIEAFIAELKIRFNVQGNELKAKNLYESKPLFIKELVEYIIKNEIRFFIELMDKRFYIHMPLIDYFLIPYYSLSIIEKHLFEKRMVASHLEELLNIDFYDKFISAVKENTNEALEEFYDFLIDYFNNIGNKELSDNVSMTKEEYYEMKEDDPAEALRRFLPIPDENPNRRLIHFLPNYGAFTNIIGRANLFRIEYSDDTEFEIIHDEQKQFDIIFEEALEDMKNIDSDSFLKNINKRGAFNIDEHTKLTFTDSKTSTPVQIADLIAGVVMRFWADFIKGNESKIQTFLPVISQLNYPKEGASAGINYVVPVFKHQELMKLIINHDK